jgi:hypothetical protein
MEIRYLDFLKLYEQQESFISLSEIEKVIKNIFNDTKVSSVSTVYEKDKDTGELKLVITINNLFYEKTDVLHTRFVFLVDNGKTKLLKNKFFYLYDINCDYREVDFDDVEHLETKLNGIIDKRDFGKDITELSDINVTIAGDINEWLEENEVDGISIYSIAYHPIVDNMPCESLSFKFEINLDDERLIELRLKKLKDHEYKFTFKEGDWFHDVTITDIKGMVQTIGETIKNHIA